MSRSNYCIKIRNFHSIARKESSIWLSFSHLTFWYVMLNIEEWMMDWFEKGSSPSLIDIITMEQSLSRILTFVSVTSIFRLFKYVKYGIANYECRHWIASVFSTLAILPNFMCPLILNCHMGSDNVNYLRTTNNSDMSVYQKHDLKGGLS